MTSRSFARVLRRAHVVVALLAALALAACGDDGSGPREDVRITLEAAIDGVPTVERLDDGTPFLRCIVGVTARAAGSGRAEWISATLRWYAGDQPETPFDTVVVPRGDLLAAWIEGADITAGQQRSSRWTVAATVPFDIELVFRYRTVGSEEEREVTVPFRCGPPVPAGAGPPVITSLTMALPATPIEPGDSIDVTFSATSASSLWRSAVFFDGPCTFRVDHVEALGTTVTRTVRLPIPSDCPLGVPFSVAVSVLDGAARSAVRSLAANRMLVDVTPPSLFPMWFPPQGGSATTGALMGTLFVGDSLQFIPNAGDRGGVAWLVWEVLPSGERDSIAMPLGNVGLHMVKLPVRPSWQAMTGLRLRARDRSGNESAWAEFTRGALFVGDDAPRPSRSLAVAGEIRWATADARRNVLYLLQANERRIRVVDVATMKVTRTIELGQYAVGMDLTIGGDSLVLALPAARALGIIDLRAAAPTLTQVALPSIDPAVSPLGPQQVMAMANGHAFVLVWGNTVAGWQLIDVDLATGAQRLRTDADVAGVTIIRSLDQRVLLVQGSAGPFQRWSSATDAFTSAPAPARANGPLALDGTGATAATDRHLYDTRLAYVRSAQSPLGACACAVPVALSPDGSNLFYLHGLAFYRARTSDGVLVDRSRFALPGTDYWNRLVLTWPGSDRLVAVFSRIEGTVGTGAVVVMD